MRIIKKSLILCNTKYEIFFLPLSNVAINISADTCAGLKPQSIILYFNEIHRAVCVNYALARGE